MSEKPDPSGTPVPPPPQRLSADECTPKNIQKFDTWFTKYQKLATPTTMTRFDDNVVRTLYNTGTRIYELENSAPAPSWLPKWATKDYFLAHPEKPKMKDAAPASELKGQIADLQARIATSERTHDLLVADKEQLEKDLETQKSRLLCGWCRLAADAVRLDLEASEIPSFDGSCEEIATWAQQVRNFCFVYHYQADASENNRVALISTILSRLSKTAAAWAIGKDARDYVRPTASDTIETFLLAITSYFTDDAWICEQARTLYSVPSTGKSYTSFRLAFEYQAWNGKVPLDDNHPLSAAATALRTAIGAENRDRLGMMAKSSPDSMSYHDMSLALRTSWKTTVVATPLPLPCKRKRFNDAPAIPSFLRGKFAEHPGLREKLVVQNRCFACRRREADHDPDALSAARAAGMFSASPSARSTDTE